MPTAKDLHLLDTEKDRCSCGHHWLTHTKRKLKTAITKKNHGWCVLCKKWCDVSKRPGVYNKLKE